MRRWVWPIVLVLLFCPTIQASWSFQELNYSPGESIMDRGIAWHPSGGYALIAADTGLYRYSSSTENLTYQSHSTKILRRVAWSPDGTYALITGSIYLYRYDHSPDGFGSMTEITSIEMTGGTAVTCYDVVWDPANPEDPPYIAANLQTTSGQHRIVIYRYESAASPYEVFQDYSGGTTYANSQAYAPVSVAFQADGDYFVIANSVANGYSQGILVYDPDQSTFPKEISGAMQYFSFPGDVGNARTVSMSPLSGTRFVLLKGNGEVLRLDQTGLPAVFVKGATGGPWYTSIFGGDSHYSYDGSKAVILELQDYDPYHTFVTFDGSGNFDTFVNTDPGINRLLRLYSVKWHPFEPYGLMAGEDRWIIRFDTDEVPYPVYTATPEPTATPLPPDIPATGCVSLWILGLLFSSFLIFSKRRDH
ncbi:hypothetical protein JW979_15720 [bacterium]|nr:hypothetical protein [candidate division CSSED10-310 bacterium]